MSFGKIFRLKKKEEIKIKSDGGEQGDKRAHNSTTKVSFCTFVSLHDSDHGGVVRIFVALSCEL